MSNSNCFFPSSNAVEPQFVDFLALIEFLDYFLELATYLGSTDRSGEGKADLLFRPPVCRPKTSFDVIEQLLYRI